MVLCRLAGFTGSDAVGLLSRGPATGAARSLGILLVGKAKGDDLLPGRGVLANGPVDALERPAAQVVLQRVRAESLANLVRSA